MQPYLDMIEQLQNKQREKEAEVVVLKYALLEMDRKFQELEKKLKAPSTTAARAGPGRTTTAAAKTGTAAKGSTVTTPRGNSRAPVAQTHSTADARQRSKTPVASKMQNSLNTSVTSKSNRESIIGK